MESVPFVSPLALGVKVTPIVQVAPEATLGTQSLDAAKFAVVVMLVTLTASVP